MVILQKCCIIIDISIYNESMPGGVRPLTYYVANLHKLFSVSTFMAKSSPYKAF
jgi:hypothetical protein